MVIKGGGGGLGGGGSSTTPLPPPPPIPSLAPGGLGGDGKRAIGAERTEVLDEGEALL